jgi:hypothetical protein
MKLLIAALVAVVGLAGCIAVTPAPYYYGPAASADFHYHYGPRHRHLHYD